MPDVVLDLRSATVNGYTPESLAAIDVGLAYRDLRERVTTLLVGLEAEQWERIVPHCPEWTVRQTLAHMTGVIDDAINQNMAGVATPPWTQAHLDKRAGRSGPEVLDEWNTYAPFVEAVASQRGMALSQLLFDAVTHEHDLRHTLGSPGARDSTAVAVGLGFVVSRLVSQAGGSPARIIVDGTEFIGDAEEGKPVLRASAFDVVRSVGSRRSREQVEALDWSPSAPATVDGLTFFGYPPVAINE
jgi:uncharacterized protein (TIGR03083 family)